MASWQEPSSAMPGGKAPDDLSGINAGSLQHNPASLREQLESVRAADCCQDLVGESTVEGVKDFEFSAYADDLRNIAREIGRMVPYAGEAGENGFLNPREVLGKRRQYGECSAPRETVRCIDDIVDELAIIWNSKHVQQPAVLVINAIALAVYEDPDLHPLAMQAARDWALARKAEFDGCGEGVL